jgi:hypothetical protein
VKTRTRTLINFIILKTNNLRVTKNDKENTTGTQFMHTTQKVTYYGHTICVFVCIVVAKIMKPVFEIHVMLTVDQIFVLS